VVAESGEEITSSSAVPIALSTSAKNLNWLLLTAVLLTVLNGFVISFVAIPAVADRVGLVTGYSDGWAETAQNVLRGNGFVYDPQLPSNLITGYLKREPVYPLFLAFILSVFGKLEPYMMIFQILINSLTCYVVYLIASKSFGRGAGLIASFLYALYPFASWYVSRVAYETLLGFLVALLVLSLVKLFERLTFERALVVGLLLGITVLCRGTFLLFPFALLPGLFTQFGIKDTRVTRCWLIIVFTTALILSPWIARNYLVSGDFVPVTTVGGTSYFIGNKIVENYSVRANTAGSPPEREVGQMYTEILNSVMSRNRSLSHAQVEAQADKYLIRMALNQIIADPLTLIEKVLKGLALVWFVCETTAKSNALLLMQGPLVLLCFIGILFALKEKRQVLPLLTILVYFTLIQTAFSPYGRYSYPMVSILIVFAAYTIDLLRGKYLHKTLRAAQ